MNQKANTPAKKEIDGKFEKFVTVAADSVQLLRKIDVYRVLENITENHEGVTTPELAAYICSHREDLKQEVEEVMQELGHEWPVSYAPADASAPAPTKPEALVATQSLAHHEFELGRFQVCASLDGDGHLTIFVKSLDGSPIRDVEAEIDCDASLGYRFTTDKTEAEHAESENSFARASAIKSEYLNSACEAGDVDDAVLRLMAECSDLFPSDAHAWSFLMEEPHEDLEKDEENPE